jgi:cytochrome c peroxidase
MRHVQGLAWLATVAALALWVGGCQKIGKFPKPKPEKNEKADDGSSNDKSDKKDKEPPEPKKEKPLDPDLAWEPARSSRMAPEVPIKFVHQGNEPDRWKQLDRFWTLVRTKPSTPLSRGHAEVHIKVPLGLDEPAPPPTNPPTVGKWALGKRLFFDASYLYPDKGSARNRNSCASCHKPDRGFTFGESRGGRKPATLFNVGYNPFLFWDGRTSVLEEVVQRTLEDERRPGEKVPPAPYNAAAAERRHVWSGVVRRLRGKDDYVKEFRDVFGSEPTQDNIGKALATYLRTILCGGSVYDRARQAAGAGAPAESHFEKLLDTDTLKAMQREDRKPAEVAKELVAGYKLFRGKARCYQCHGGSNFTDNDFHNAGVGDSRDESEPGKENDRFAALPIGLKDPRYQGAYKTPTLRGAPQARCYFHTGDVEGDKGKGLLKAVEKHVGNLPAVRDLKLTPEEIRALTLFLYTLDAKVDAVVSDHTKQPEGVAPRKS